MQVYGTNSLRPHFVAETLLQRWRSRQASVRKCLEAKSVDSNAERLSDRRTITNITESVDDRATALALCQESRSASRALAGVDFFSTPD